MANWYLRSAAAGTGAGTSWTNAATTVLAAAALMAAGDTLFVADDHSETISNTGTFNVIFPGTADSPNNLLCVDHTVATPSAAADLRTTAKITYVASSGTLSFQLRGCYYCYGVKFVSGDGTAGSGLAAGPSLSSFNGSQIYDSCAWIFTYQNNANSFSIQNYCRFVNTYIDVPSAATDFSFGVGNFFEWFDTPAAFRTNGGSIHQPITSPSPGYIHLKNCDFTQAGAYLFAAGPINAGSQFGVGIVENCKMPPYGGSGSAGGEIAFPWVSNSFWDDAQVIHVLHTSVGNEYYRNDRASVSGIVKTAINVVRTGGTVDNGITPISWQFKSQTRAKWITPLRGERIAVFNSVTGNLIHAKIEGIADPNDYSALPTNKDFWLVADYLGHSGDIVGSTVSGSAVNFLDPGTALAASTQAWDSQLTARANSTAYSQRDVIKLASNPGRVFFCTTAGTTAGSEPGGYATAIDGGSVTDGTATFKAGWRFSHTIQLGSPAPQVGVLSFRPNFAKASAVIFIDPLITLS